MAFLESRGLPIDHLVPVSFGLKLADEDVEIIASWAHDALAAGLATDINGTSSYAFAAAVLRTFFFSYAARAAKTFPRFPYDQSLIASRTGARLQPSSEMLYSTFGGTVG